jgi:competence protein ComEC
VRRILVICAALAVLAAAAALGAAIAQHRTAALADHPLTRPIDKAVVEGWVADAAMGATRPRLKLLVRSIEGVAQTPRYVEISTTDVGALPPGRAASCVASLRPNQGPLAPGAYDGAFQAYFERVGATGFSFGACRTATFAPPARWDDELLVRVAAVRRALTETIAHAAPGQGGAVAAALVTGDRSLISPETNRIFRDSGLGHMLSVSGLHMGLVAGMTYGALHLLFALIAPLALRFPIRKWAALAALLVTGAYLVISGNSVPAQRSFVMIAVAMGAILVDRPALTMRSLAVAAVIVVALTPEAVVTPGFQMSFAASAALLATFEAVSARRAKEPIAAPGPLVGALQSGWAWFSGALAASAVAGLATDPFALMHFQRVSFYALPTNLIATPITTFILAPAAAAAAILAPFGAADAAWRVMGDALDFLIAAAASFANRPEAVRWLPRPSEGVFLLWVFAVCWACLWRGALRWLSAPILVFAIALYVVTPKPILWVDASADAVLARDGERWVKIAGQRGAFEAERIGQLAGLGPRDVEALAPPEDCGQSLCLWRAPDGRRGALIIEETGFAAFCAPGAIVVSRATASAAWRARCRPAALIQPGDLATRGGASITLDRDRVFTTFAQNASSRPWRVLGRISSAE